MTTNSKQHRQQRIFARVWQHFVVEKAPLSVRDAEDGDEMYSDRVLCFYRGDNEAKCAVGLFIPEERYDVSLEGEQVESLWRKEYLEDTVEADDLRLLTDLRNDHDNAASLGDPIEGLLRTTAGAYGLQIPA